MISLSTRVAAATDQLSCDVSGEAVVLHFGTGKYYGLDPVGARIWSLLQQPRTVGEIRDALLDEYDVDLEQCETSVVQLLEELASHGLIEVDET